MFALEVSCFGYLELQSVMAINREFGNSTFRPVLARTRITKNNFLKVRGSTT